MSDVDVLRAGYADFARGDIPAVLAVFDPEIEWVVQDGAPAEYRGAHHGPQAVASEVFLRLGEVWESFGVTARDYLDAGSHIVVLGHYSVVAKGGGAVSEVPFAHVWTMRDGRALTWREYSDTAVMRDVREGVAEPAR